MKQLRFKSNLVPLILSGEKYVTWRMFDDKDLTIGDELDLINSDTNKHFGNAVIVNIYEKKLKDIVRNDFEGHETYINRDEMFETYRGYYGYRLKLELNSKNNKI